MSSRIRFVIAVFTMAVLAGAATPVFAQSLADVARKEEERRKAIRQPAKIYTNKDLSSVPPPSAPPPSSQAAAAPETPAPGAEPAGTEEKGAGKVESPKDQAYWSGRTRGL